MIPTFWRNIQLTLSVTLSNLGTILLTQHSFFQSCSSRLKTGKPNDHKFSRRRFFPPSLDERDFARHSF